MWVKWEIIRQGIQVNTTHFNNNAKENSFAPGCFIYHFNMLWVVAFKLQTC